ncbi:MAG: nucleotidyltransferase domain-containing protein [Candidatus Limnocylindrales bacterium]|nr:nucleotidyltransferase domain-containing protein [Candidatus Limnocylindrales bacterium]
MHDATTLLLFGSSAVRREILAAFFATPGVVAHPRELARQVRRPPQVVGRELRRLEAAGILTSETIGRARRYRVDDASPIAAEVRSLVAKTIGIEARLQAALATVPGVEEAYLYGSYARRTERPTSDLDVLVVGAVDRTTLSERLVELEQDLGRDINVTAYERAELDALVLAGDPFFADVFANPRIRLVPPERAG